MPGTWGIFMFLQAPHSRPLTMFLTKKFQPLSFVTSLNTGKHATGLVTRPFLSQNKASLNVLIMSQSLLVVKYHANHAIFFWSWQPICSLKPTRFASRNSMLFWNRKTGDSVYSWRLQSLKMWITIRFFDLFTILLTISHLSEIGNRAMPLQWQTKFRLIKLFISWNNTMQHTRSFYPFEYEWSW